MRDMLINKFFKLISKNYPRKKQDSGKKTKTNSLHHYIPRFYLKNFGSNGKISVWEKQTNQIRRNQNPAKVAASRGFYTFQDSDGNKSDKLEEILADLEGHTQSAIRNTDNCKAEISPESKVVLANFIALQHVRTPKQRKITENNVDLMAKVLSKRITTQENYELKAIPSKEMLLKTAFDSAPAIYDVLIERPWFQVNFNTPCLITSDNPVIKIPHQDTPSTRGIGLKTCKDIWFPLTAEKLIIMREINSVEGCDGIHILNEDDMENYQSIIQTHNHYQILGCYMEAYGLEQTLENFKIKGLKIHTGIKINHEFDTEIATDYNSPPKNPRPKTR